MYAVLIVDCKTTAMVISAANNIDIIELVFCIEVIIKYVVIFVSLYGCSPKVFLFIYF